MSNHAISSKSTQSRGLRKSCVVLGKLVMWLLRQNGVIVLAYWRRTNGVWNTSAIGESALCGSLTNSEGFMGIVHITSRSYINKNYLIDEFVLIEFDCADDVQVVDDIR